MHVAAKASLAACATLFCGVVVLLGMLLLASVQLRSSAGIGANYDTWRRGYQANIADAIRLSKSLVSAQTKADNDAKDADDLNLNKDCLRLFKDGRPNHDYIDTQTSRDVVAARQAHTPPEMLAGDVKCLVKGYARLDAEIKNWESRAQQDKRDTDRVTALLAANHQQNDELTKGHQDFLAFMGMETISYYRPFLLIPYDLLMLLLVMLMGATGGVVRLLRDYGAADQPNPSQADYFIVPLIGAVVAMCAYVLARTGVLALSAARDETSLSPFMISFVGIISGLLAKEVIDLIAVHGRKLLRGQGAERTVGADQGAGAHGAHGVTRVPGGPAMGTVPQAAPEHAG